MGFKFRKVADKSYGERVAVLHPETGHKVLYNPETNAPEPWPLAGVKFDGEAPDKGLLPQKVVVQGKYEGWIELSNERIRQEPGGPKEDPWRVTHSFIQADQIIFKMIDRNYYYKVLRNPGVYQTIDGREVIWYYEVEAVSRNG